MKHLLATLLLVSLITLLATDENPSVFKNLDVFELEYASDPRISPDGKTMIYVRNGMDIMKDRSFRVACGPSTPDGTHHRKLTNRETNESNPRWSPSESHANKPWPLSTATEIYVLWTDTRQLTKSQNSMAPTGLSWSPGGTQIAFP